MNLSFHEKSLWLMFASLALCFTYYVAQVFPTSASNVTQQQMALFVAAVVVLVIFQVIGHVVIALIERRTQTDERDHLIGLIGTRNGAYVLAAGAFFAICAALLTQGNFIVTHVMLGFWMLAHLVDTGSQLVLHRRGN